MSRALRAAGAVLTALAIVGCGGELRHGVVESKEYRPSHSTIMLIPHTVGKTTVLQPMPYYIPEAHYLHLRNGDQTGRVKISKAIWDKFSVGEFFSFD